jgi:hypothetical protein
VSGAIGHSLVRPEWFTGSPDPVGPCDGHATPCPCDIYRYNHVSFYCRDLWNGVDKCHIGPGGASCGDDHIQLFTERARVKQYNDTHMERLLARGAKAMHVHVSVQTQNPQDPVIPDLLRSVGELLYISITLRPHQPTNRTHAPPSSLLPPNSTTSGCTSATQRFLVGERVMLCVNLRVHRLVNGDVGTIEDIVITPSLTSRGGGGWRIWARVDGLFVFFGGGGWLENVSNQNHTQPPPPHVTVRFQRITECVSISRHHWVRGLVLAEHTTQCSVRGHRPSCSVTLSAFPLIPSSWACLPPTCETHHRSHVVISIQGGGVYTPKTVRYDDHNGIAFHYRCRWRHLCM